MSTNFNVNVNGKPVQITSGEKIDDLKAKFGDKAEVIFEGVDADNNGVLDAGEVDKLKTNLKDNDFTIQVADDGKTPKGAYNNAIQQLKSRYTPDNLKEKFKTDDTHTVVKGETLYTIAKKQLEEEGILTDFRSVNHRISQIAAINNINDVNNIKEGTKLITKLTEDAIKSVKDNDNDSVKAFTGESASLVTGEEWTKNGVKKRQTNETVKNQGAVDDERVDSDYKKQRTLVDGKTSTIKVAKNGLNMGKGVPVDKDGNELKNFKDPKYKAGGSYMKYTNANGEVMYQTVYGQNSKTEMLRGVKISAPTLEEAKAKEKSILDTSAKIKTAPTNETAEAKATRMATNLTALKELVTLTGGNEQVIKNVAEKLRGDDYVDRKSDDYKAFVQDLLLTRNADVVSALTKNGDNVDMSVVEYDRTSHETLAGMYQEIREKEKAGEKLSADEVDLKNALVNTKFQDGFKIEADEANHVNEKYLWTNNDGKLIYKTTIGDKNYWASDEKLLDEFVNKLKAADTDEKKAALFKEYANTKDVELANCLLCQAKELKAKDEDIKTVINANGMYVLSQLDCSDDADWSNDIKNAMLARIKDIYTKEKGNLENAEWLGVANDWIRKLPDDQREAARTEIAETYFEKTTTKDEEGNDKTEYTFNPTRRPTKEEMDGLFCVAQDGGMSKAILNYTQLEDMGKGQYNEAIESHFYTDDVSTRYAEMVETMEDPNDVIDFIDNKIATNKEYSIPFDKILEKFPDDKNIKDKLIMHNKARDIAISQEHRLELAKAYCKVDGNGNYTFDKSLLPKGATVSDIIRSLPFDCNQGEAQKIFKAIFKTLDFSNLNMVQLFNDCSFTMDNEMKKKIRDFILNPKNKGTEVYNSLVTMSAVQNVLSAEEKQKIFDQSSKAVQKDLSNHFNDDSKYYVAKGEKLDNIIKDYLTKHLDKFPALKKSVDGDKDKKKWTEKRINEALNDYVKDFREDIAKDLGLESASKIKYGDVLDLSKIKWDEHQPNWFNYNLYY